jgi:hypothetical protein
MEVKQMPEMVKVIVGEVGIEIKEGVLSEMVSDFQVQSSARPKLGMR